MLRRRRSISTKTMLTNASVNYPHYVSRFFAPLHSTQNDIWMSFFSFFLLPFYLPFGRRPKRRPPIIERTCAFDAKIYKIVDAFLAVSPCVAWSKNLFKLFYFYFQLPTLLVDFLDKILPILTATEDTKEITQTQINAD